MPPPRSNAVRRLAEVQDLALSRAQLLALGASSAWIARRVSSGAWQRPFPGVVVTHSGPVSWVTRARCAVLYAGGGAALSHAAAAHLYGFDRKPPPAVDVSVPATRRVTPQPGLRIHLRRRMPRAQGSLPCVNPVDTVLDVAGTARDVDAVVAAVTAAAREGIRPWHVRRALEERARHPHRALLRDLLADVADGVESPLEARYRRDVERAHGLPRATLQGRQRLDGGWIRSDARYAEQGVRIELDGALAHPGGRTDADTWRDNAVLLTAGDLTLRYRWRHVAVTPCRTALQVSSALRGRGWSGRPVPCGPGCAVAVDRT